MFVWASAVSFASVVNRQLGALASLAATAVSSVIVVAGATIGVATIVVAGASIVVAGASIGVATVAVATIAVATVAVATVAVATVIVATIAVATTAALVVIPSQEESSICFIPPCTITRGLTFSASTWIVAVSVRKKEFSVST